MSLLATLLGTITIEQNRELMYVRTIINNLLKEKGFCVVGGIETASSKTALDLLQQSGSSSTATPLTTIIGPDIDPISELTVLAATKSPARMSLPSTSFHMAGGSSNSNKFVSREWCFVDCKYLNVSQIHPNHI